MKLAVLNSSKVSHGLVASNPSSSSRPAAVCVGAPKTRVLHIPQAATAGHDVHRSLRAALADACPTMVKVSSGDASGLEYCDVKVGEGDPPVKGTFVKVHYEGRLDSEIASGTFDSSYERGRPLGFSIGTGTVIKGWDLGILGDGQTIPAMKPGGKRKLVIPSELGYGPRGAGGLFLQMRLCILMSSLVSLYAVKILSKDTLKEHLARFEGVQYGVHYEEFEKVDNSVLLEIGETDPFGTIGYHVGLYEYLEPEASRHVKPMVSYIKDIHRDHKIPYPKGRSTRL
eukprot:jgi/Picre1/30046/NNA_005417.t1